MTLNEVYVYLKMNGLPVTFQYEERRIMLEGSTAALGSVVFLKVYKRRIHPSCTVASDPSVLLDEATYRDLDKLVESYIDFCDVDSVKRIRVSRLRYAIDRHKRQTQTL